MASRRDAEGTENGWWFSHGGVIALAQPRRQRVGIGGVGVVAFVTGLLAIALVLAWRVPESPRPRIV